MNSTARKADDRVEVKISTALSNSPVKPGNRPWLLTTARANSFYESQPSADDASGGGSLWPRGGVNRGN